MKLRLDLRLSQKLIMTPQLQQAIAAAIVPIELQQSLQQHLMENPCWTNWWRRRKKPRSH